MKKLITAILILALLLPAAALAGNNRIVEHYTVLIDAETTKTGKGASPFDFDSLTIDLYLSSEEGQGYLNIARFIQNIYLNDGMIPVSLVDIHGTTYIVNGAGTNIRLRKDEETGDLWIEYGSNFLRMHRVEPFLLHADYE